VTIPTDVEGYNLLPLTAGGDPPRSDFPTEAYSHNWKPGSAGMPPYCGVRSLDWLYVEYQTGETELYDMRNDPYQLRNQEDNDRYKAVKHLLARRLHSLEHCAGDRCNAGRPSVHLALRELEPAGRKGRRVRRNQSCVARGIHLGISGRERRRVERVQYTLGRRRVGSSRRPPFSADVKRSLLPAGRELRVRARVSTLDGRVATVDRALKTCRR
jgi:hypothetical protein